MCDVCYLCAVRTITIDGDATPEPEMILFDAFVMKRPFLYSESVPLEREQGSEMALRSQ